MRAKVTSVDYAPDDLYEQLPFTVELLRQLPGADRADYWLGRLTRPLRYAADGGVREVHFVVLAARYAGEAITPRVRRVIVGITYVLDDAQSELPTLDMSKCLYAAIGEAEITPAAS